MRQSRCYSQRVQRVVEHSPEKDKDVLPRGTLNFSRRVAWRPLVAAHHGRTDELERCTACRCVSIRVSENCLKMTPR